MSTQERLRETATLKCLAGLAVLLVCLLVGGCLDLYVGDRVSRSPPGLPEADYIVWSGRSGRVRRT